MFGVKWFVFFFMAFALCSLLSGVIEGNYGAEPPWQAVMSTIEEVNSVGDFVIKVPALAGGAITALWDMFTWNYTYLEGGWAVVRWFVFMPISAALAMALMITFLGIARGSGT